MRRAAGALVGAAFALTIVVVTGGGDCNGGNGTADAGNGGGGQTCLLDSDCTSGESCVAGLCLRRCSVHDVCDVGQYCSGNGFCETGCRPGECQDGTFCANGVCMSGTGSCATKADCPSGLVCRDNICTAPPPICATAEDCPDEQLCNGFTQVCFDPSPTGCNNATDCVGEAGCEAGCVCNASHLCVVDQPCTEDTELQDCGVGGLCYQSVCMPTPGCSSQTDCDTWNLYCNTTAHICQRTEQCTSDAACVAQAPATYCNLAQHRCEVPTCINGGVTCNAGEECNTEGRCVPPAGAACSSNLQCCPDDTDGNQTCATGLIEYCDIPAGSVQGDCRRGCRTDTDCNIGAGESCNAVHQCVGEGGGGTGGDGDPCMAAEDCRAGYWCGPLTGVCYEMCETEGEICPETGKTCTMVIVVPLCMDSGGGGLPSMDASFPMVDGG